MNNSLKLCFCNFERYEVRMLLLKHTATCRHERTRARSDRADKHAQPETQWTPTVEVQRSYCHSHSSFSHHYLSNTSPENRCFVLLRSAWISSLSCVPGVASAPSSAPPSAPTTARYGGRQKLAESPDETSVSLLQCCLKE